jgi:hypothetical protein
MAIVTLAKIFDLKNVLSGQARPEVGAGSRKSSERSKTSFGTSAGTSTSETMKDRPFLTAKSIFDHIRNGLAFRVSDV